MENKVAMLCDKNVEYSVLGSIMIDNELFYKVMNMKDEVFNFIECRELFRAMREVFKENDKIDIVLLGSWVSKRDTKLTITKISEVQSSVPSTANFDGYLNLLIDYYNKRELDKLAKTLNFNKSSEEMKSDILDKITDVFVETERDENMSETTMNICEEVLLKKKIDGVKTGINLIDLGLSGLRKGSYTLLAAESGVGKTIMAINMYRYMIKNKSKAVYFSLEVPKDELIRRMLSAESKVLYKDILNNNVQKEDEEDFVMACQNISACKFNIIDDIYDLNDIIAKVKLLKARDELDIFFIDQISLVGLKGKFGNKTEKEEDISTALKRLAMETKVPVVVLAQVSIKETAKATEKRPILANIQGSTKKIQDADLVVSLYRDKRFSDKSYLQKKKEMQEINYNSMDADENPEVIEIDFLKSRNSTMARYSLRYLGEYQLIESKIW